MVNVPLNCTEERAALVKELTETLKQSKCDNLIDTLLKNGEADKVTSYVKENIEELNIKAADMLKNAGIKFYDNEKIRTYGSACPQYDCQWLRSFNRKVHA